MTQRVLVIDDEPGVTDLLAYNLQKAHFEVLIAADGRAGLDLALTSQPDLVVLDLMLPLLDGLDVCRAIRQVSQVPIIMLTARDDEIDRVVGLELGADDYLCKPFGMRELLARIRALLRRSQLALPTATGEPALHGPGGLTLERGRREARVDGQLLELSRLEFDLLSTLLLQRGQVFTREQLLEQVWGYDFPGDDRAVDSAVKRLRAKLRAARPEADCILAVRGIGYKLSQEAE
jgi:DNA-binding response OmpR family regulator